MRHLCHALVKHRDLINTSEKYNSNEQKTAPERFRAAISSLTPTTWDTTGPLVGSQYLGNRHCRIRRAPAPQLPQFTAQHSSLKLQVNLGLQESTNWNRIWWSSNTFPSCWLFCFMRVTPQIGLSICLKTAGTLMESPPFYEHTPPYWKPRVLRTCRPGPRCFNNGVADLQPLEKASCGRNSLQRVSGVQGTFTSQGSCFNKLSAAFTQTLWPLADGYVSLPVLSLF